MPLNKEDKRNYDREYQRRRRAAETNEAREKRLGDLRKYRRNMN